MRKLDIKAGEIVHLTTSASWEIKRKQDIPVSYIVLTNQISWKKKRGKLIRKEFGNELKLMEVSYNKVHKDWTIPVNRLEAISYRSLSTTKDFLAKCKRLRNKRQERNFVKDHIHHLEEKAEELGFALWIDGDGAVRFNDEDTFENLSRMLNDLEVYYTQPDM